MTHEFTTKSTLRHYFLWCLIAILPLVSFFIFERPPSDTELPQSYTTAFKIILRSLLFLLFILIIRFAFPHFALPANDVSLLLLLSNPLILWSSQSISALSLLITYGLCFCVAAHLRRWPTSRSLPLAGLSLATLYLISPYALYILPALIAGLLCCLPIRVLKQDLLSAILVILFPVAMAVCATFYWAYFHGSGQTEFFISAPDPFYRSSVWLAHFHGDSPLILGVSFLLILLLCAGPILRGGASTITSKQMILFASIVPASSLLLATYLSPELTPLPFLACLLLVNIVGTKRRMKKSTRALIASWTSGAFLVWLYSA